MKPVLYTNHMNTEKRFLKDVEAHLKLHGIKATTFGIDCGMGSGFVWHLRDGRSSTLRTYDQVKAYMVRDDRRRAKRKSA